MSYGRFCRAKHIKYSLVHSLLKSYFNTEAYQAYWRVPEELVDEADICEEWDKASASDYFSGVWKNVKFQFCDLALFCTGKGFRRSQRVFSGQFFIIETGLALQPGISIRERKEPLSAEVYAGLKNSDRFFLTGNEQFDRQFDVYLGSSRSVRGFEHDCCGVSIDEQHHKAHRIVDVLVQDILDSDAYAVSQTRMRFIGNRLYLAIENARDTFELRHGEEKTVQVLRDRFDEEIRDMTTYLDLLTRRLPDLGNAQKNVDDAAEHFEQNN